MKKVNWYFDFISPFAYLQTARFNEISQHVEIQPVPVVFGALLKHWEQLGPAEIPPKRIFVYRFFQWQAARLGMPYRMPPRHPFNPLPALRLCVAAGADIDAARKIFGVIYGQGIQPEDPEGVAEIGAALGIDDPVAAMADPDVKETLRRNTETAVQEGTFGVPTFVLDGQVFWGGDATDMMLDFITNPGLFSDGEMQRLSSMPMGLVRQR